MGETTCESPTRLIAYVWWCGDDYCDCTEARIQEYQQRLTSHGLVWQPSRVLWAGTFRTDGEVGATTELNRTARHMRRKWHDAYEVIEWPWTRRSEAVA